MTDLLETLRRLATRFVARDIMRPKDQLTCAEDYDGACRLLEQNPQYDVIPLRQADRLVGFLERGSTKAKTIQIQHVVSAGTPITELVDSLCDRRLLFVVGRHEVVGLIHFSDLNDPVVKLPCFVLLEGLERQVADSIRFLVRDDVLPELISDPRRLANLKEKMASLQKEEADRDWVTLFYFPEIFKAGVRFGKLQLELRQIEDLSTVRTRVAHAAADELVESHADIQRLSRVRMMCMSILFGDNWAV